MNRDVQAYFDALAPDRHAVLSALHNLIIGLFPEARVDMQYRMPTYHSGDGWVAIANQKHYVSLYTCGSHHIGQFKADFPRIKTGKGCINFKPADELPVPGIVQVIAHAMAHPKPS